MSYYLAKRSQIAKQYLAEREAMDKIKPPTERLTKARAWLDEYLAQPRPSRVDWAPRFNLVRPDEDFIEGEFTELAEDQQ